MEKREFRATARAQLHDLLDRVLDGDAYAQFWFVGFSNKSEIHVKLGSVNFDETRGNDTFHLAVTRAEEATDE